jgi:hypothetical protein
VVAVAANRGDSLLGGATFKDGIRVKDDDTTTTDERFAA